MKNKYDDRRAESTGWCQNKLMRNKGATYRQPARGPLESLSGEQWGAGEKLGCKNAWYRRRQPANYIILNQKTQAQQLHAKSKVTQNNTKHSIIVWRRNYPNWPICFKIESVNSSRAHDSQTAYRATPIRARCLIINKGNESLVHMAKQPIFNRFHIYLYGESECSVLFLIG